MEIKTTNNSYIAKDVKDYYNRIYNNIDGEYTLDFASYHEKSFWKNAMYYFQEFTGLCTY